MIRISRTGFAVRLLTLLAVFAGTIGVGSQEALAQKGKPAPPPPPPPAGLIYIRAPNNTISSMNSDGSGITEALPAAALNALNPDRPYPSASPSLHLHNGSQWFLTTKITGYYDASINSSGVISNEPFPHFDTVAVRRNPADPTQLDIVQLTDSFGIFDSEFPVWSNDSNESVATSFVHCQGADIREAFTENPDGSTVLDYRKYINATLRLPITVPEIVAGDFPPFDDSLSDAEIDGLLWPHFPMNHTQFGTTSPAGDLVAYAPFIAPYNRQQLQLQNAAAPDFANPVKLLWDGSGTAAPHVMNHARWSPDGQTIAFVADVLNTSLPIYGEIWTVPASGNSAPKKVLGIMTVTKKQMGVTTTTKSGYDRPMWSPDSNHLVVRRADFQGTTQVDTHLVRVPAAGGTAVDLGSFGTDNFPMHFRWVPNN